MKKLLIYQWYKRMYLWAKAPEIVKNEKPQCRGSHRGILVMRDWLILFSVKCEFNKLFFVIRDLKVLRDP